MLTESLGKSVNMSWDYFCKIFCISVRERTDRQAEARKQVEAVGISDRVEFVLVEKGETPEEIERGIYESHIKCIQRGLDAGADRILIFENDILFDRFDPANLKECVRYLKSEKNWKVLLLGCLINRLERTESSAVVKVKYRSLSHAYALNRNFAKEIVRIPFHRAAYDTLFCPYDDGIFAIYPSFAFQSDSPSGNSKYFNLARRRRFFGGFRRIQKFNEFYFYYRTPIIAANAVLFLFLGGILSHWFL